MFGILPFVFTLQLLQYIVNISFLYQSAMYILHICKDNAGMVVEARIGFLYYHFRSVCTAL